MIKAIIFDFDNTLADRCLALEKFSKHIAANLLAYDSDNIQSIVDYIVKVDRNWDCSKSQLYEYIADKYSFKSNIDVNSFTVYWNDNFYKYTTLKKDAITVLSQLKSLGYKLAIITNGNTITQNAKIDYTGIRKYFDNIIVSETVGIRKPDIGIYNYALEQLNVLPDEAIMVGDQQVCDILGARQAGITPVWIHNSKRWDIDEDKTDYIINELTELIDILTPGY